MSAAVKRFAGKTLPGSLWHAAPMIAQVAAGIAACGLWVGVASPNLQLLPGVNARSDAGVEIALQSALLGIDDGSNRSASAVLAASYAHLPSPADLRRTTAAQLHGQLPLRNLSLVVRLSGAATAAAPTGRQANEPDTPAPLVDPSATLVDAPLPPVASGSSESGAAATEPAVATPVASHSGAGAPEPSKSTPTPATPKVGAPPTIAPPATAALLDQQIVFDSTLPAAAYVGRTLTVSASATSGLPVTLSTTGGSDVCKLTGSALQLRAAGTCTLEARQPGNAKFKGRRLESSFAVVRSGQTISFDAAPAGAVVGEHYRLDARATSGLAVAVSSLTPAVCALSGPNVRAVGAGSCRVEADQAGNDAFEPAAPVQLAFEVQEPDPGPRSQTVVFTSTAPSGVLVGGAAYLVSASASSGLTVDLSVDAASAGVCTIAGSRVTFVGEGTCTVAAAQSGGHGFLAATPASQSILVARAAQGVSFLSTPPASAVAGLTTYVVVASSSASLPVTLSVAQSSAAVCAISGAVVTAIAAGTCEVEADQPGDAAHQRASQAVQTPALDAAAEKATARPDVAVAANA